MIGHVLIRADATPRMGGGHVMRCLTLADALAARGATVQFICAEILPTLARRVEASGHRLSRIAGDPALAVDNPGWDTRLLTDAAQRSDAEAALAAATHPPSWVIVDHYRLSAAWETRAAMLGRVLVIDDLANRAHHCDMLLDQTFGRARSAYESLTPQECRLLLGSQFAMLRPEFHVARPAALVRRRERELLQRIVVSLGTTDVGAITAQIVNRLIEDGFDGELDVVLGPDAASLPDLRRLAASHSRVSLHVDPPSMAEMLLVADLAIGAGGMSSWERCSLALPALTLVLASNQEHLANALEQADAVKVIRDLRDLVPAIVALQECPELFLRMTAACAALVDASGVERVIGAMMAPRQETSPQLSVRSARNDDSEDIWLWRNDPTTRTASQTHSPISWPAHHRWWQSAFFSANRRFFIVQEGEQAVGVVRFDRVDGSEVWEVSINVRPDARGRGVGAPALTLARAAFLQEQPGAELRCTIHEGNRASQLLFERSGFRPAGEPNQAGFRTYRDVEERTSPVLGESLDRTDATALGD